MDRWLAIYDLNVYTKAHSSSLLFLPFKAFWRNALIKERSCLLNLFTSLECITSYIAYMRACLRINERADLGCMSSIPSRRSLYSQPISSVTLRLSRWIQFLLIHRCLNVAESHNCVWFMSFSRDDVVCYKLGISQHSVSLLFRARINSPWPRKPYSTRLPFFLDFSNLYWSAWRHPNSWFNFNGNISTSGNEGS